MAEPAATLGSGAPTVVFESGAAEAFYTWWNLQHELRGDLRTCSYDRAGFGWSDPPPARSVAEYVEDLHALLEKAGEKPPFLLVGHSLGGTIVQRYYWRYPDEVAAIIASTRPTPSRARPRRSRRTRRRPERTAHGGRERWRSGARRTTGRCRSSRTSCPRSSANG